jgi:hypothetical protein
VTVASFGGAAFAAAQRRRATRARSAGAE